MRDISAGTGAAGGEQEGIWAVAETKAHAPGRPHRLGEDIAGFASDAAGL